MKNTLVLTDYIALSPLGILLLSALILITLESFSLKKELKDKVPFFITLSSLFLALLTNFQLAASFNPLLTNWLKFDYLAKIFTTFFLLIGLSITILSKSYFKRLAINAGEFYFFLIAALAGLLLISNAADFLILFLGIETLSIALYILVAYSKKGSLSSEAALKYFFMGSIAAAFLLYGIALIYGAVGTTRFELLASRYQEIEATGGKILFLSGIFLVTGSLAFEAALFPLHFWAPDVYRGATNIVTAFMATATKIGAMAAFIRIFFEALPFFNSSWNQGVVLLIYPTLFYANFLSLQQFNLKRFFAYSGIAQAGFLMVAVVTNTPYALYALLFYLSIYTVATLGAFSSFNFLESDQREVTTENLKGFFYKYPLQAYVITICLLTLSGLPPTIGFFAKFFIFKAAFESNYLLLVIFSLLTTLLSIFYYLRLIGYMLEKPLHKEPIVAYSFTEKIIPLSCAIFLVLSTLWPNSLLTWLKFF